MIYSFQKQKALYLYLRPIDIQYNVDIYKPKKKRIVFIT